MVICGFAGSAVGGDVGAGHSHVDTTMLYTVIEAKLKKELVYRLFDRLMEVEAGKSQ